MLRFSFQAAACVAGSLLLSMTHLHATGSNVPSESECISPYSELELDVGLFLKQSMDNEVVHIELTYEGNAWLGFGFSENAEMVGSTVVIGLPNDDTASRYYLAARDNNIIEDNIVIEQDGNTTPPSSAPTSLEPSPPTEYPTSSWENEWFRKLEDPNERTLEILDQDIVQNETHTVLSFSRPIHGNSFVRVNPDQFNTFIYAVGYSNEFGFHSKYGSRTIEFSTDHCEYEDVASDRQPEMNCFSSEAQVYIPNGEIKRMDELRVGDEVLTKDGYERIYAWGHYDPTLQNAEFLQLFPSKLEVSSNHLVYVVANNKDDQVSYQYLPASAIRVGDKLSSGEVVTAIRKVHRRGVYAPFTPSGTIVVNNQVASNFVSLQDNLHVLHIRGWSTGISHHGLAHAFEAPHRIWCHYFFACDNSPQRLYHGISNWARLPMQFFLGLQQTSTMVQMVVMLFIFVIIGGFVALEWLVMNHVIVAVAFIVLFCWSRKYFFQNLRVRQCAA